MIKKYEKKIKGRHMIMCPLDTVVFETLYDAKGHIIAKHEDKDDEGQTVTWKDKEKPKIGTTLIADGRAKATIEADTLPYSIAEKEYSKLSNKDKAYLKSIADNPDEVASLHFTVMWSTWLR